MADDLLIGRAARLEIGLSGGKRGKRLGAARFRLRHVGARHLADIETVLGRLQLLGEHGNVVLAQTHDGLIAHDIDVRCRGVEQDRLLDRPQRFAGGLHRGLRLPDGVEITETLEERLGQIDRIAARIGHPVILRVALGLTKCLVKGNCSSDDGRGVDDGVPAAWPGMELLIDWAG